MLPPRHCFAKAVTEFCLIGRDLKLSHYALQPVVNLGSEEECPPRAEVYNASNRRFKHYKDG